MLNDETMRVEIAPFEDLYIATREDIGYTEEDAKNIYENAKQVLNMHIESDNIVSAYIIGSYATRAFTPERSDCDIVAFYDGDEVLFYEHVFPVELCNGRVKREMNFSVCIRPIKWLENYWDVLMKRIQTPFSWKVFNAIEDYLMIHDHSKFIYGKNILDLIPVITAEEYARYLDVRTSLITSVKEHDKHRLGVLGISKAIISNARDSFFVWSGQFRYETFRCVEWINTVSDFSDEGRAILKEAVMNVDTLWEQILENGNYEVQLMKIIRKCKKFGKCIREYEEANGYSCMTGIFNRFESIPYNLPPITLHQRLVAEVEDGRILNVKVVE